MCELHFVESDFVKEVIHHNDASVETLTAKYATGYARLQHNAVPSVFPNCPQYLSYNNYHRENPEEKKMKKENQHIKQAIAESLESAKTHERKYAIDSFEDLVRKINLVSDDKFWTVHLNDKTVSFCHIENVPNPKIFVSVVINEL